MPRIDPAFQHDVFRFIIESRRNKLLSRWLGEPDKISPEKSVQGIFEQTQQKISELPQLLDPAYEGTQLRLLAWLVGWDDNPLVDFIDDLTDDELRKLIKLSVPLWQQKGTAEGLVNAIRVFTGKSAIVQDWFWHRWIIDEGGFWVESRGIDPYLVGTIYTEADEPLTWVVINREGIGETQRRLVYDLLTFIHGVGEHFGVVYAAFADDFTREFSQWTQIGTPGTLVTIEDDFRGGLLDGAEIQTNVSESEMSTWSPFQRAIVHIEYATDSGGELICFRAMRNVNGSNYYEGRLASEGSWELRRETTVIASGSITMPVIGTPVSLELRVEPINTAQTKVSFFIGGELQGENTFLGGEAYIDSGGGVTIERQNPSSLTTFIDNVMVLATPARIQFIGQQAITPTPGLGGPQYIADPDPGLEPFVG